MSSLTKKLLPFLVRLLTATLRIKHFNVPDFEQKNIYIFWHSQMLAGWYVFRNKNYAALVSKSKDGELLTALLKKWGFNVYRGSSSSGGKLAVKEIIASVDNGNSVVITPDGPRGPLHEIKNGALIISKECSIPITPLKITYSGKVILKRSWDRFEIPLPFTKCEIHFGNQHHYTDFLPDNELEEFKTILSNQM